MTSFDISYLIVGTFFLVSSWALPLNTEDNEPEPPFADKRQGDLDTAGTLGVNIFTNPGLYGGLGSLGGGYGGGGLYGAGGGINPYQYGGIGGYGSSFGISGLQGGYGGGLGGIGGLGALGGGYGGGISGLGGGLGGGLGALGGGYGGGIGGLGGGLGSFGGGLGGLGGGIGGLGGGLGGLGGGYGAGIGGLGGGLGGGFGALGGGLGGLGGIGGAGGFGGLGQGLYSGSRKSMLKGKLIRFLQGLGQKNQGGGMGMGNNFGPLGPLQGGILQGAGIGQQMPYGGGGMYNSYGFGNQYGFGAAGVGLGSLTNGLYQNQPSPFLETAKRRIFDSLGGYFVNRLPNFLDRVFDTDMDDDDDYD